MKVLLVSTLGQVVLPNGTGSTESQLVNIMCQMGEVSLMIPKRMEATEESKVILGKFKSIYPFKTVLRIPLGFQPDYIRTFMRAIRDQHFDIIIYSFSFGDFPLVLLTPRYSKLIYLAHIFEYEFLRKMSSKGSWLFIGGIYWIREKLICRLSDQIISVSDDDRKNINEKYGVLPSKIAVLQLGKEYFFRREPVRKDKARESLNLPVDKKLVIFHGSYGHPPNKTAIKRIIENIAPIIAKRNPNIEFVIAGLDVQTFSEGNVRSIGFVDDLLMLMDAADLAIIPVEIGGGLRVKMIDYMSRGLPVIATKEGMEGINYTDGGDVLIADDDEDFANKILKLIDNPNTAASIGKSAKEYAMKNFSPEAARTTIESVLKNLSVL